WPTDCSPRVGAPGIFHTNFQMLWVTGCARLPAYRCMARSTSIRAKDAKPITVDCCQVAEQYSFRPLQDALGRIVDVLYTAVLTNRGLGIDARHRCKEDSRERRLSRDLFSCPAARQAPR